MPSKVVEEAVGEIEIDRGNPRQYIGASIIGNDCTAYIAFCLRGFPEDPIKPKMMRIFTLGHKIEDIVIKDLRDAGYEIIDKDPFTGWQKAYSDRGGHVSAHLDGKILIDGEYMLLEIKSMNDRNWKKFKKVGVQVSHPKYYAQCQMMMGLSDSDMSNAMLVAYNKNTSEYHSEVFEFDEFYYESLRHKIDLVMMRQARKIAKDSEDWRCRVCFRKTVCWQPPRVEPDCNLCQHSVPLEEKKEWWCTYHDKKAILPCDDFLLYAPLEAE